MLHAGVHMPAALLAAALCSAYPVFAADHYAYPLQPRSDKPAHALNPHDVSNVTVPPPQPRLEEPSPHDLDVDERLALDPGLHRVISPRYPQNYPHNADRRWVRTGASGQRIVFWCPVFNLQGSADCTRDYLSVNGRKFCGNRGRLGRIAGTRLDIRFHSDASGTATGFTCRIRVPSTCCGAVNRRQRIVGGVVTQRNEYPWMAGLVSRGGWRTWCGGSVINNRYVLTAAHCTVGSSAGSIQVLLREHRINVGDGQIRYSLSRIINHPRYRSASGSGYDVALLRLSTTINFATLNNRVAPVCLPDVGGFAGVAAIVTGWGTTSSGGSQSNVLREVTVRTMTNTQCRRSYSSINPTMICAGVSGGGKDSCQGDSGGPLVRSVSGRYHQIGVVSWGRGCALANYPGVYARVTSVFAWIERNTQDASLC